MASAPPMIELRLLGSVDLWSPDGIAAARVLSQPKRLAVLAYLAGARPRGFHRRDSLVALFWPELNQEHARAALRNALHFLRRALGDSVVLSRGDEITVNADATWCDVASFDAALDAGDAERALSLYRGPFLAGLHVSGAPEFDRWVDAERDRVRRRARDGAWRLAEADGNDDAGVATTHWMRVALEIDPDDEEGMHRLLRALEAAGDVAGAVREYARFAQRLAAEYELEPSPATRALVAAIRARGDFRRVGDAPGRSPNPGSTSIVVLPFVVLGTETQGNHHGDALAEEITVSLSTIRGLRVIARSSSARLRSGADDHQAIGAELNVRYIVDGSISYDAERLRVAARLVDAATATIVWAETYVGTGDEVFTIQEQVTRAISTHVALHDADDRVENARSRYQGSVHAYDCYHRAMQELARYSERGLSRALELAHNGLALVGENDLLLATVAYIYIRFLELGVKPNRRYLEKAEDYAARALRANPDSCLGHVVKGLVGYKRGDIVGCAQNLKRALEIDPNQRDALFWLSIVYLIAGQIAAARPLLARLLEIDPLTPVNHCLPGYAELLQGNPESALTGYRRMHRMDSSNPLARWFLALVLGRCGRRGEAIILLDQILRDTPGTTFARHALFFKHALRRDRQAALAAATPELLSEARWDQHASWWMGATFALIGEREAALDWLANASSLGYINYPFLSRFDPFFETLRGDERFWQLMTRVKHRWEQFTP